jgi:hypothetical protein
LVRTCAFDLAVFDINVAGFNISPIAGIVAERGLPIGFVGGYGLTLALDVSTDQPHAFGPLV